MQPGAPHPSLGQNYKPGSTRSSAHDWSKAALGGELRTSGRHFIDSWGRVCCLRGANLSGTSKTPANHDPETFLRDHKSVTFVGKPFPLTEAPEHLARLRRWGLTFIRFMVTWEALEHAGPGEYDAEYLSYVRSILTLLPEYGMSAFVSMHQDVWSRYSGGSGAPAWTLELVGFDLTALEETGAAYLGGVKVPGVEMDRGRWPTGYQKLAASTMSTIFFAGKTFAPKLLVDRGDGTKVNAQVFLQGAFFNCYDWMVKGLKGLDGVIGFEIMNEPHRGYVELPSMHEFDYNTDLHLNDIPSALQSFMLGAGYPTSIPHWTRSFPMPTRKTSHNVRNIEGRKVWRADGPTGGQCVWEAHGVWGYDTKKSQGVVLKETYFTKRPADGEKVDWYTDYWFPFVQAWAKRVGKIAGEDKIVFAEAIPNEFCPRSWTPERQPKNMVYAPHWYDLNALFAKEFSRFSINVQGISRGQPLWKVFYWGHRSARENYALQLRNITEEAYKSLGERPVLIGETGIPLDMNEKEAFTIGDFTWQERMMDALITGLERSLVGFTLWNYNPDNTDSHGDYWNGENFSWFSKQNLDRTTTLALDQSNSELDAGGRLLHAVVRPYAAKLAGIPLRCEYELNTGRLVVEWANSTPNGPSHKASPSVAHPPLALHTPLKARESEFFMPHLLTNGRKLIVEYSSSQDVQAECDWTYDADRQTLFVVHEDGTPGAVHRLTVTLDPPLKARFPVDASILRDFAKTWISLFTVLLAMLWMFFIR